MDLHKIFSESLSFDAYQKAVEVMTGEKLNSGNPDEVSLFSHVSLNDTRIQRLLKTLSFEDFKEDILSVNPISLLVISEGWCGDASQILPVLVKMQEMNPNIRLGFVFRDQNPLLIEKYNYKGTASIPIVIGIRDKEEVFTWGPRPEPGLKLLQKYKEEESYTKEEFSIDLQKWYNKDKGQTILQELLLACKSK
ncbi:MAG: thioredoxin family protein [Flavobacteriaceae bacterium]|nr:MAG: thioredoxin family protein [Flavobacteriaceae bacterium]